MTPEPEKAVLKVLEDAFHVRLDGDNELAQRVIRVVFESHGYSASEGESDTHHSDGQCRWHGDYDCGEAECRGGDAR